ncbi:class I SAM-dependent methyltransferase [Actinomadura geliboluensis]|uniref:hypothetical protein n=1 Tax=Actinomadura geliboluensis TaxID=882440 RepID=UPI0036BD43D1
MPDSSTGHSTTEAVVARYSGLARLALAGGAPHDGATCGDSCVDAAGYPSEDGMPEAALRASLGCGNPLAVAELRPGETVLDLGSGGGPDVLLSARRVGTVELAIPKLLRNPTLGPPAQARNGARNPVGLRFPAPPFMLNISRCGSNRRRCPPFACESMWTVWTRTATCS